MKALNNIEEIRDFFKSNTTPIYFIGPSCFHLTGMEKWIANFRFISHIDSFDGQNEHSFVPKKEMENLRLTKSITDINNYLLSHPEVIDFVNNNGNDGQNGIAIFYMFDHETEILAEKLNLQICFPNSQLRTFLDNNLNTNFVAEKADIPCVPNILTQVNSYEHLMPLSSSLGKELAIQTPFGHAGHNTYIVSSEEDYNKYASIIEEEKVVKITKRKSNYINAAIEACVTNQGTIVAPLMTDLTGFEELTPYKAGWCGNELFPNAFNIEIREKAKTYTQKFGDQLRKEGYKGYFELDFLIDKEDDEIYFNELNASISALSNLTNNSRFANTDVPLFLFHLLDWMNVPFSLDVDALNNRWFSENHLDEWSQVMIKHTPNTQELITDIPASGIWRMKVDGNIAYKDFATHQNSVKGEKEALFINFTRKGEQTYKGSNLGMLIVRGRLMNEDCQLTKRAKKWINAIRSQYRSKIVSKIISLGGDLIDKDQLKGVF